MEHKAAQQLNNRGVAHLKGQRPQRALKDLSRALKATRQKYGRCEASGCSSSQKDTMQVPLQVSYLNSSRLTPSKSTISTLKKQRTKDIASNYISLPCAQEAATTRGLYICFEPVLVNDRHCENFKMNLNVAIIFNMALCHHQIAMSQTSKIERRQSFMKAWSLYKLSCQIQSDKCVVLEEVYLLSILNNIGAVLASLGKGKLAKRSFSRLLSFLTLMQSRGGNNQSLSASSEILNGFHGNVSLLILRDNMLAAAA